MLAGTQSNRELALKLLSEGSYAQCIDLLQKALTEQGDEIDLHLYLAYAYAKDGKMHDSVEALEHATDLFPTSAKVHYNLGVAYQRIHNNTQAKEEYLRALGLDANYIQAKHALDQMLNAAHIATPGLNPEPPASAAAQA